MSGLKERVIDMSPEAVAKRKAERERKRAFRERAQRRINRLNLPQFPTEGNRTTTEKKIR
jgi:hypothetical protein